MKKRTIFGLLAGSLFILFGASCKSGFEKIRSSGNTDLIYKKAFEYYDQGEYQRAQTLFELIIPAYRGKAELEKIYFTYSNTYYYLHKFVLANYYYTNFATTFPHSELREEASFQAAYSNYQLSPIYRLDQTNTYKAIEEFETFANTFPNSERVKEANRLIDELRIKLEKKTYEEANLYFNLNQYQAATTTYENLLKDFPETTNAEQVRFKLTKTAYLLAENSIFEKQLERYKKAVEYASYFVSKFSDSEHINEVQSIYDNSLNKLKSLNNGRHQGKGARTRS